VWTAVDLRAVRPTEGERARALADAVFAALLTPAVLETAHAA
jgi:hypothetical protein